jgi:hypothetical protein
LVTVEDREILAATKGREMLAGAKGREMLAAAKGREMLVAAEAHDMRYPAPTSPSPPVGLFRRKNMSRKQGFGAASWARGLAVGLLMAGVLATEAVLAAGGVGEWLVEKNQGCMVWNGYPTPGEAAAWEGECDANRRVSGEGTLYWSLNGEPNGQYRGRREDGKANGYGINVWRNGDRYEGHWRNDLPDGEGTYTWANGSTYQGHWAEGRKDGKAVYYWSNGNRFEGTYRNDMPHAGIFIKTDGTRYFAEISGNSIGPGTRFFSPEERNAVRTVGNKVCRPSFYFFGMFDSGIVGFVENVAEDRIQIRIARTGLPFLSYQNISLEQGTIIWDDANNWEPCRNE